MRRSYSGFTIIEILIVISVIGIITAITSTTYVTVQRASRDTQKESSMRILSSALEKYYSKNGEYPDCTLLSNSNINTAAGNLENINPKIFTAPGASPNTNSIVCSEPSTSQYGYFYCGGAYTIKYIEEESGDIAVIYSQQKNGTGTGGTTNVSGGIKSHTFNVGSGNTFTATSGGLFTVSINGGGGGGGPGGEDSGGPYEPAGNDGYPGGNTSIVYRGTTYTANGGSGGGSAYLDGSTGADGSGGNGINYMGWSLLSGGAGNAGAGGIGRLSWNVKGGDGGAGARLLSTLILNLNETISIQSIGIGGVGGEKLQGAGDSGNDGGDGYVIVSYPFCPL